MADDITLDPSAPVPRHLYKYRSLRGEAKSYARDLIVNQQLRFARPAELNDPFEFRPVVELSATHDQWRRYAKEAAQRNLSDKSRAERRRGESMMRGGTRTTKSALAASYRVTMDNVGVFSMSSQPLDLLMWPHYADNHAGVCVRFASDALVNAQHMPMRVTYSCERPVTNPILEEPEVMLHKAALTKGLPWAYEQEWRLILNRLGGRVVRVGPPVISGVILGARVSPEDRAEVLGWVAACDRPMEVFEARFHPHAYALDLEPVSPAN